MKNGMRTILPSVSMLGRVQSSFNSTLGFRAALRIRRASRRRCLRVRRSTDEGLAYSHAEQRETFAGELDGKGDATPRVVPGHGEHSGCNLALPAYPVLEGN